MITAHAQGRVELLGNHTDYNDGLVLAVALERGVTLRGGARSDRRVVLTSETLGESYEGLLEGLSPSRLQPWANYVLGVVDQFQRHGANGPGSTERVETFRGQLFIAFEHSFGRALDTLVC